MARPGYDAWRTALGMIALAALAACGGGESADAGGSKTRVDDASALPPHRAPDTRPTPKAKRPAPFIGPLRDLSN